MYLVVIAWIYVVLLMSLAEAFSSQGSVLGACVTFVLYGVLPLSIVVYILGTPARKRALRQADATAPATSTTPDAGRHAPGAAQTGSVPAVGEEERRP
jgi:Kef-type K+ transport system membrane component KefB